jgi:hypothetical protein
LFTTHWQVNVKTRSVGRYIAQGRTIDQTVLAEVLGPRPNDEGRPTLTYGYNFCARQLYLRIDVVFLTSFVHVTASEPDKGIDVFRFICDDKKLVFGLEASRTAREFDPLIADNGHSEQIGKLLEDVRDSPVR